MDYGKFAYLKIEALEKEFKKYVDLNAELHKNLKRLIEEAAEEIENCYGKETPLTEKLRSVL